MEATNDGNIYCFQLVTPDLYMITALPRYLPIGAEVRCPHTFVTDVVLSSFP